MYMSARHPKKYPDGEGLPVTIEWKARVIGALEANKRAGIKPDTPAALARMIDADKGGVSKMLKRDGRETTKYAPRINKLLGIDVAMVANPRLTDDELDQIVAKIRTLPPTKHERVMASLRSLVRLIDD